MLGDSRLLIFGIAALLTAWVFAPPGLGRRFAVVAPLSMLLGLLNPYIAGWVIAQRHRSGVLAEHVGRSRCRS